MDNVIKEIIKFGAIKMLKNDSVCSSSDIGQAFPASDMADLERGARFIPGEVTLGRRRGEKIIFITDCGLNCWYWLLPDGSRVYHYDPLTYDRIGEANGRRLVTGKYNRYYKNGPGPCPHCGNPYTSGGRIEVGTEDRKVTFDNALELLEKLLNESDGGSLARVMRQYETMKQVSTEELMAGSMKHIQELEKRMVGKMVNEANRLLDSGGCQNIKKAKVFVGLVGEWLNQAALDRGYFPRVPEEDCEKLVLRLNNT